MVMWKHYFEFDNFKVTFGGGFFFFFSNFVFFFLVFVDLTQLLFLSVPLFFFLFFVLFISLHDAQL